MIKKEGMGRGEDDRSHFLGEPVARISVDDSGEQARAHSQDAGRRLIQRACLLAAMKSKTNRSSLRCTSAHVCPCCPRTARFLPSAQREQFAALGKLPTSLRSSRVFSDSESVTVIPHTTRGNLPGARCAVGPERRGNRSTARSGKSSRLF